MSVIFDIAVLLQDCKSEIMQETTTHIVNLDTIKITRELFKHIFYPYGEQFGIDKSAICNNRQILPYISFTDRTVNGRKFYLLESLLCHMEYDLNVSRNCFTTESKVELTNEIMRIGGLCDINCCSVLSTITWANILALIANYKNNCNMEDIVPILAVSIIFKTPTVGVENTIIKFNYEITN